MVVNKTDLFFWSLYFSARERQRTGSDRTTKCKRMSRIREEKVTGRLNVYHLIGWSLEETIYVTKPQS